MRGRDPPIIETIKAWDARQHWSALLNNVFKRETRVLVEKSGIPVAALISAEDFEQLQILESQRQERFRSLEEAWEAFADLPAESVEQAVARAIAEVRSEQQDERDARQHSVSLVTLNSRPPPGPASVARRVWRSRWWRG